MTRFQAILTFAMCMAASAGCHSPDGEPVTMGQWWESRFGVKEKPTEKTNEKSRGRSNEGGATLDSRDEPEATQRPVAAAQTSAHPASAVQAPEREPPRSAITSDVLVLNDETVDVMDVLDPIRGMLTDAAAKKSPRDYANYRDDLVRRQIIEAVAERLIWQEARTAVSEEMKPQVEHVVVAMEKDRINREFGGLETNYEKYLAKNGRTREEVRKMLERGIMIDKYLKDRLLPLIASPTRTELKKYYDQHQVDFTTETKRELYLIDIPIAAYLENRRVVTDAQIATATAKARAQADEAARAIAAGQPFEEVAKKYSKGLNKEKGGAWGVINEPLQERWEVPSKRLFTMSDGQVSEVIESAKSFFIVKAKVVEQGKTTSFTDAQPEIMRKIRQERFVKLRGEFLQKRFAKSQVGSMDNFYRRVLAACPPPGGREVGAPVRAGLSSSR